MFAGAILHVKDSDAFVPKLKEKIEVPAVESELVLVDAGPTIVGDVLDGLRDATPHRVRLSPYWIARHEVTFELWQRVADWARGHGYADLPPGLGKMADHPVYAVSWLDAVKWCNARSEMEGLTPCYHVTDRKEGVFRAGVAELSNRCVKWEANGYRLPTEAEWEVAARGQLEGRRFPWGDEISHQNANYSSTGISAFDKGARRGPPVQYGGSLPHTAPVGSFSPNQFGLYDMSGNVFEWCWDFYDHAFGIPRLRQTAPDDMGPGLLEVIDPLGPDTGSTCVVRGGSWRHDAGDARCASRFDLPGAASAPHVGFRVARRD